MAEPKSRVVVVGKLLLLVGLPITVMATVFGTGVHYGHAYRADILKLERDLLGMDVQVPVEADGKLAAVLDEAAKALPEPTAAPAPAPAPVASTGAAAKPGPANPWPQPSAVASTGATAPTGAATPPPAAQPAAPQPAAPQPVAPQPTTPTTATPAPQPVAPAPAPEPEPAVGTVYPLATAPDISDDLRSAYDRTRVLRVKVLVDRAFIEQNEQWLAEIDGLVGAASRNYSELFGMQFQLWGIVEWDVARNGLDIEQLYADARTRSREGADLLLAITGRPLDSTRRNGWSETPEAKTPRNTAFAVVYADARRPDRLLRAIMHEIGHCFGAHDVTEPGSNAWRRGSVMSYANVPSDAAPWFDSENLRRILERKHNEIESESRPSDASSSEHEN